MSQEEDNVALLREAYDRWHRSKGGSVDHWLSMLDDQVTMTSLAGGAEGMEFTRTHKSRDEARSYFAGLTQDWEMIRYEVEEFIASGERVVAVCSCSFRNLRTGKEFNSPKVDIWRIRDGRAVEYQELYDTHGVLSAARP
jgi:ketosteroid isomerase-like protein